MSERILGRYSSNSSFLQHLRKIFFPDRSVSIKLLIDPKNFSCGNRPHHSGKSGLRASVEVFPSTVRLSNLTRIWVREYGICAMLGRPQLWGVVNERQRHFGI